MAMRFLLVPGSTRRSSTNTAALRTAALLAPDEVTAVLFEGLADLPAFTPDEDPEHPNPAVRDLREQIAAADAVVFSTPEVSPSTFFRYFPTKEEVVLWDQFDARLVEAYRARPAEQPPLQALRSAFTEAFGGLSAQELADMKQRSELMAAVPSLRAALFDQIAQAMQVIAEVTAERTGRSPDDFAVRAMAGAELGIAIAATLHIADHPGADMAELIDEGIVELGKGFETL
jgi:AcrR family transcriptional regulator